MNKFENMHFSAPSTTAFFLVLVLQTATTAAIEIGSGLRGHVQQGQATSEAGVGAAVHLRSQEKWQAPLHKLTQEIMSALRSKKERAVGTLRSAEQDHNLAMEYEFGLHKDLIPMDDFDVLAFHHGNQFTATHDDRIKPGAILFGSLLGKW